MLAINMKSSLVSYLEWDIFGVSASFHYVVHEFVSPCIQYAFYSWTVTGTFIFKILENGVMISLPACAS